MTYFPNLDLRGKTAASTFPHLVQITSSGTSAIPVDGLGNSIDDFTASYSYFSATSSVTIVTNVTQSILTSSFAGSASWASSSYTASYFSNEGVLINTEGLTIVGGTTVINNSGIHAQQPIIADGGIIATDVCQLVNVFIPIGNITIYSGSVNIGAEGLEKTILYYDGTGYFSDGGISWDTSGHLTALGITSSLYGTSSNAITASYVKTSQTASYITSSNIVGKVAFSDTASYLSGSTAVIGNNLNVGVSVDSTGTPVAKLAYIEYNNTASVGSVVNTIFRTNQINTGSTGNLQGLESYLKTNASSNVATTFALVANTEVSGSGGVTNVNTLQVGGITTGTGSITNWKNINVAPVTGNSSNVITNMYGVYVADCPSNVTNKYGIYQTDPNATNLFSGSIIGRISNADSASVATTASFSTTASFATTASFVKSSSFATTASWANLASQSMASISSSFVPRSLFADSASWASSSISSSFLNGPHTGSTFGTASWAINVVNSGSVSAFTSSVTASFLNVMMEDMILIAANVTAAQGLATLEGLTTGDGISSITYIAFPHNVFIVGDQSYHLAGCQFRLPMDYSPSYGLTHSFQFFNVDAVSVNTGSHWITSLYGVTGSSGNILKNPQVLGINAITTAFPSNTPSGSLITITSSFSSSLIASSSLLIFNMSKVTSGSYGNDCDVVLGMVSSRFNWVKF